ncbi:hypothetical protein PR002_g33144 [Phytophthora rubi]|uniref:Uncharacterized protein n=1 Tax=Phytophthora rubi TaxID=129364 RepID=A0A6A3G2N3_9STRA|nr:hypothetical protein PR002_g33144 [Phytophthora rubi]
MAHPHSSFLHFTGNVAAERKLRTPGNKVRGWWRGGEAGGGVRARAWLAAAGQQQAAPGSVVAASELEHGKLRLASSKVRGCCGVRHA